MQSHESISSFRKVRIPANRKFGLTIGGILLVIAAWPMLHHAPARWPIGIFAAVFLAAGVFRPRVLEPLNRLWFKFGLGLNRIVSPIIMAILFFGVVTPLAWILRKKGDDPLLLKRDPEVPTYWINRTPAGPAPGGLMKQF